LGNPREQLRKAAITSGTTLSVTNGGKLNREQADSFISKVYDESKLVKMGTTERVDFPSGQISLIDFPSPITRISTENKAAANYTTHEPVHTAVNYDTVKAESAADLTGEADEDSIEGKRYRKTVGTSIENRVATDIEILAIEGDTATAGATANARLLQINDGWHKLTAAGTGSHIVNANGRRISMKLLNELLMNLPTKYQKNLGRFRFLAPSVCVWDFAYQLSTRASDKGDFEYQDHAQYAPYGIPLVPIPLMPIDLAVSGTDSTGGFIWLADPKVFVTVMQRDVKVEQERVPRGDKTEITIHHRSDFIVRNTDEVVKATNVLVDINGTAY